MFGDLVARSPILIANALMAVMFIARIVELAPSLFFYRRGLQHSDQVLSCLPPAAEIRERFLRIALEHV